MHSFVLAALLLCLQPQTPASAPVPPDVPSATQLIEALRQAHRTAALGSAASFAGTIEITPTAPNQDSVAVLLDVRFRRPNLIRYRIQEGERQIERGQDLRGGWVKLGAEYEPESVTKADYAGDAEQLRNHIALAAQLLDLLDPARVIEAMTERSEVAEESLVLGRDDERRCHTISGTVARMPIFVTGDTRRAFLKLWVDATTHRLVAARTTPLDDHGRAVNQVGEFVRLPEHDTPEPDNRAGALLPVQLVFEKVVPGVGNEPMAMVRLRQLEVDAALPDATFDRRQRW